MKTFLLKVCLLQIISSAVGFNGWTSLYNTHEEPPIDADDYKSTIQFAVKEEWIQQKLDHFSKEQSTEWRMRYLENDRFFQSGEKQIKTLLNNIQ